MSLDTLSSSTDYAVRTRVSRVLPGISLLRGATLEGTTLLGRIGGYSMTGPVIVPPLLTDLFINNYDKT